MNYFKRLETIFIVIVILVLGVLYGLLSSRDSGPLPAQSDNTPMAQEQTQQVSETKISYQGEDGKSVMELLRASHQVAVTPFGDLGEFVSAIDGIEPDSTHFWSFYVNGEQAQVGASSYITKSSETIEWKLEEIK